MERHIPVPEAIRRLMAVLEARGFEACAVGGCVRDSLLGRTPSDWDLCTSALPEQTDAADEAILRVVTLSRSEGELKIVAMTAGIKTGDADEPPEKTEGSGEDYAAARAAMKERREASLTHATDWVVEENAIGDALEAFVIDPELTYDASIYVLKDQSAREFLDAFGEEQTGPARALEDLGRACRKLVFFSPAPARNGWQAGRTVIG